MDNTEEYIEQSKNKLESLSQFIKKKQYPDNLDEQLTALADSELMKLYRELRQKAAANR